MSLLEGATLRPSGLAGIVVEYGDTIDPSVHDRVLAADAAVRAAELPGLEEVVPSYRSLLLRFDPLVTTPDEVAAALGDVAPVDLDHATRQVEVAVDFTGGDDLEAVAEQTGLGDVDAVVDLLTSVQLRVYLHGFAPGFAYLGGVPPALHVPRRATPRPPVAAGSVLLAAGQAALCPVAMPTGWWVVGHTDAPLFDPEGRPPVPFSPGDEVRLVATS